MPYRKAGKREQAIFDGQVVLVFQKTTVQERAEIAQQWCLGEREAFVGFAQARGLLPIALITGALIDIEHPLLVDERGCLRANSLLGCAVLVTQAYVEGKVIPIPVLAECWQEKVANMATVSLSEANKLSTDDE